MDRIVAFMIKRDLLLPNVISFAYIVKSLFRLGSKILLFPIQMHLL